MAKESVTYRLGVSGDREVIDSLAKIGEAGDTSAKRLSRAYEREAAQAQASIERLNKRTQTIMALGVSPAQQAINSSTGISAAEIGRTKSAEAAMRTFIAEQDRLAASRQRLMTQLDPLFAAQTRYNATMAEAARLDRAGALAAGDLTRIHAQAKAQLDQYSGAMGNATQQSGAMRFGFQNLGFQVSDFAVQVGAGTSATRAFALQGPQAIQALAMMGGGADASKGKFAAFAGFLAGPWGAAITVAVAVAGALATKLLDVDEASKKAEFSSYKFSDAQSILGTVVDLTTGKINTQSDALLGLARAQAIAGKIKAEAEAADARQALTSQAAIRTSIGAGFGGGLTAKRGRNASGDIAAGVLEGSLSTREAVAGLNSLRKSGYATREQYEAAATAVTSLGVALENIKVWDKTDKALNGDRSALAGFLTPKTSRGGGAKPKGGRDTAADEIKRALEERERVVRSLTSAYDPLGAAQAHYADQLKAIADLEKTGGLTADRATFFRNAASTELFNAAFADEIKAGEDAAAKRKAEREDREKFVKDLLSDQKRSLAFADAELGLIKATGSEREIALSKLALELDLKERGVKADSEEYRRIIAGNEALIARGEILRESGELWEEQRRIGEALVDTVLDPGAWNDWGELGKKIIQDLIREMTVLALINPLKNSLFNSGLPTLGGGGILGFFAGMLGGGGGGNPVNLLAGTPYGNAIGTEYSSGGLRMVGEFGRELVQMPRGAKVLNAGRTRQMERGSAAPARQTLNFDMRGAVVTEDLLRQMQQMADKAARDGANTGVQQMIDINQRTFGGAFAV